MSRTVLAPLGLLALLIFSFVACNRSESQPSTKAVGTNSVETAHDKADEIADTGHEHAPGAHGGAIVEIGRDNYHAEVVFEEGGLIRLFTLGQDESKVHEVDSQTLTAYVKPHQSGSAVSVEFQPEPQSGDTEGKTSQFVAQLPEQLRDQEIDVTITSILIDGERFRLGFSSPEEHEEHSLHNMPEGAAGVAEQKLYLTAAGKYTEADIAANGHQTASQKFRGMQANHDLKPEPGDKICPITLTKANPKFTWIVDGQAYQFCCPPCVDEFVRMAKESPEEIRAPEAYVKE